MGAKSQARVPGRRAEGGAFAPPRQLWNQVTLKLLPPLPRPLGTAFV